MAAVDDDATIASYSEFLANFGAAYAATQESIKNQATTMATMQNQLANIQQFCMAVNQQPPPNMHPPPTTYVPPYQQQPNARRFNNRRNGGTGGTNVANNFPQQPTWWFNGNGAGAQCWEKERACAPALMPVLSTPVRFASGPSSSDLPRFLSVDW